MMKFVKLFFHKTLQTNLYDNKLFINRLRYNLALDNSVDKLTKKHKRIAIKREGVKFKS